MYRTRSRGLLPCRGLLCAMAAVTACSITGAIATEGGADSEKNTIVLASAEKAVKDHVRPQVLLSVDRLPAGGKVRFAVILDVENGWHINTNPPRPEFTEPTAVSVKAKHGTRVEAIGYPSGRDLTIEGFDEPVSVYEGRVHLFGTLAVPKDAARQVEELTVEIKFQACNEKLCLAPKTAKLTGKVPVAAPGEQVRKINEKVFEKDEQKKRQQSQTQKG